MKSLKTLLTLSLFAFSIVLTSCDKTNKTDGNAHLQVFLTDDPGNYDAVNIDVREVRINYSNDTGSGWVTLPNVKAGIYDVLRLTNGKDTLLSDAFVKTGEISQIRLVLGDNNTVKLNGQTYPLETPSAQQSGLKLNIHELVNEGVVYKLLLDFDASRSIVKTGNNKFILKPVIRTSIQAIGGGVRGYVTPNTFATAVYAIKGTDTVAGTYTSAGSYQISGIAAGSYNLAFVPADTTYKKQTKTGITVTTNNVTIVDTVKLVH